MARRRPSVLLIGNGAPGHIGGFFARALEDLGFVFRFIDEAASFAPPASFLALRAVDRLVRRPGEIQRFNDAIADCARAFVPDVVLVVQGYHLFAETLRRVRDETRAVLIGYATDNPLVPGRLRANVLASVPEYDVYASTRRSNLKALAERGCREPVFVRFGYQPCVHFPERLDAEERDRWQSDLVFIGGWDDDRVRWLAPLADSNQLRMRLYGRGWTQTPLRQHAGGEVYDRAFRLAMAGTKVAPCLVRRSNGDGHVMRSFEIPACGAFMLAERTEEHQELFEEDVHAAYFSSADELCDKTRYYVRHESLRHRMAAAAHDLITNNAHTYRDRLLELVAIAERGHVAPPRVAARRRPHAATPVFVINLARSVDRRNGMAQQLARLAIDAEFVNAHDGAALSAHEASHHATSAPQPHPGRALSASEIGCLLSHCAIYERMTRDALPVACVLEDDCRLEDSFAHVLTALQRHHSGWDVVLLGHHSRRHGPEIGAETCYGGIPIDARHALARVAEFAMGAYAYVVTLDGARKLLTLAHPVRMPADWVTGYAPAAGARLFAITPPCVRPDPVLSAHTTMHDRWTTTPPSAMRDSRPRAFDLARSAGGSTLLFARKLGVRPGSYVKRF